MNKLTAISQKIIDIEIFERRINFRSLFKNGMFTFDREQRTLRSGMEFK